jgi:hypothetical protein
LKTNNIEGGSSSKLIRILFYCSKISGLSGKKSPSKPASPASRLSLAGQLMACRANQNKATLLGSRTTLYKAKGWQRGAIPPMGMERRVEVKVMTRYDVKMEVTMTDDIRGHRPVLLPNMLAPGDTRKST